MDTHHNKILKTGQLMTFVYSLLRVFRHVGFAAFVLCTGLQGLSTAQAQTATTTQITATGSPNAGDVYFLSYSVTGSSATGTAQLIENGTVIASSTVSPGTEVSTGVFTILVKTAGTHSYTAQYSGDSNNAASTSAEFTLTAGKAKPSVSLSVNANPATQQLPFTLSAYVFAGDPTGTVSFYNGTVALGSVNISSNSSTLTTSISTPGTYTITAVYSGDTNYLPATSNTIVLTVTPYLYKFEYNADGDLTKQTDPLGHTTVQGWDDQRRLSYQTPPDNGNNLRYRYDGQGHLRVFYNGNGWTTSFETDGLGNKLTEISPDSGTKRYKYDLFGNLSQKTDDRGVTANYTYDALNRLTQVAYLPSGTNPETVSLTWDTGGAKGQLASMQDASGTTTWTYDSEGRVLSRNVRLLAQSTPNGTALGTQNFNVGYAYNNVGQLSSMTYPSGQQLTYKYNTAGQLTEIDLNAQVLISNITYIPFGPIKSWVWGNAQTYSRSYDLNGRLVSFALGNTATRNVIWDAASRITALQDQALGASSPTTTVSAGYDQRGRLISYQSAANSYGYGYDSNNNRTSLTVASKTYNLTYPWANHVDSTTGPGAARRYVYDRAGNPTTDGVQTYTWTNSGNLSTLTLAGTTTGYVYNGFSQRVRKLASNVGDSVAYAYDEAGHLIGEYDGSGKLLAEHIWLGDTPIAVTQANSGTTATPTQSLYYVFADQINTPRVLTDTNGKVIWNWEGEGFGMVQPNEDPDADGTKLTYNLRFPGQVYDKESGLFYNWHRYYDPTTGRYISSDPIGLEGGINTYAYVEGSPIVLKDPFGLRALPAEANEAMQNLNDPNGGSKDPATALCHITWQTCPRDYDPSPLAPMHPKEVTKCEMIPKDKAQACIAPPKGTTMESGTSYFVCKKVVVWVAD